MKNTGIAIVVFLCLFIGFSFGIAEVQAGSPPIPKPIEKELSLAERHLRDNNPVAALEVLEGVKDKGFGDPWYHLAIGHAQFAADRPENALDSFNAAVSGAPLFAEAWNMIGLVNFRLNRYEAAKSAYQLALAIPDYETPEISATNLALVYYQNGEYQKALEHAKTSMIKNSKFGGAYVVAAQAQIKLGNINAALDILKKGETAAPESAVEMRKFADSIAPSQVAGKTESLDIAKADDLDTEIKSFVEGWRQAWVSQNVYKYLSLYSPDFIPENNMSYTQWTNLRRKRLGAPGFIEIDISNQQIVQYATNKIYVTFDQQYRSEKYFDKVKKQLTLVKEGGNWKITRERSL
jgi:tetratricopeptide (TPR) repeat protein